MSRYENGDETLHPLDAISNFTAKGLRRGLELLTGLGYSADFELAEGGWLMTVPLPGVKKENIDVRDENGKLRIWAFPKGRDNPRLAVVCAQLPPGADRTGITSTYTDGMLRVSIPMHVDAKPRVIPVK